MFMFVRTKGKIPPKASPALAVVRVSCLSWATESTILLLMKLLRMKLVILLLTFRRRTTALLMTVTMRLIMAQMIVTSGLKTSTTSMRSLTLITGSETRKSKAMLSGSFVWAKLTKTGTES